MTTSENSDIFADLIQLTATQFQPLIGASFALLDGEGQDTGVTLTLAEVEDRSGKFAVPGSEAHRAFSLLFTGSSTHAYEQGIAPLYHPSLGLLPIFLVAVADDSTERSYEAIFN